MYATAVVDRSMPTAHAPKIKLARYVVCVEPRGMNGRGCVL